MVIAYILLTTETGKEYEVLDHIKDVKSVTESRMVYGEFDVFLRFEVGDLAMMDDIVTQIRRIPGVRQTTTLVGSP
ncbi:MAG: Lrp/AsnC ligand binding domain-containing protein [Candidatus Methanomethylicaceae archaeon]